VGWLVEERYPEAVCVELVIDNLNTHVAAALYEAFPPERARAILRRLVFHYTPKHASWLNMAEVEISVFERAALARPCPDLETLRQRVARQEEERNARHCSIHWQFTTAAARTKLHDLYPPLQTNPD
jgi:hypothetical protein